MGVFSHARFVKSHGSWLALRVLSFGVSAPRCPSCPQMFSASPKYVSGYCRNTDEIWLNSSVMKRQEQPTLLP